jgi:hypothetical protein
LGAAGVGSAEAADSKRRTAVGRLKVGVVKAATELAASNAKIAVLDRAMVSGYIGSEEMDSEKAIYVQQHSKGEEFSFASIDQMCDRSSTCEMKTSTWTSSWSNGVISVIKTPYIFL